MALLRRGQGGGVDPRHPGHRMVGHAMPELTRVVVVQHQPAEHCANSRVGTAATTPYTNCHVESRKIQVHGALLDHLLSFMQRSCVGSQLLTNDVQTNHVLSAVEHVSYTCHLTSDILATCTHLRTRGSISPHVS